jgi:hypothetical protein
MVRCTRRSVLGLLGFGLPAVLLAQDKPQGFENVQWMRLRGFNYKTGRIVEDVKVLDGALIQLEGYAVPLEDDSSREATEFLLVSSAGACIHTPPPPPNQIIHVKMNPATRAKIEVGKLFIVKGRMHIATVNSPYGDVAFQMQGMTVEPSKNR